MNYVFQIDKEYLLKLSKNKNTLEEISSAFNKAVESNPDIIKFVGETELTLAELKQRI